MGHGGSRKGSGRKPAAIEDDVRGAIKAAMNRNPGAMDKIWDNIIEQSAKGSEKHQKILLEYIYGKPKENEGQPTRMVISVSRKY
jgi:hypothetical protein